MKKGTLVTVRKHYLLKDRKVLKTFINVKFTNL